MLNQPPLRVRTFRHAPLVLGAWLLMTAPAAPGLPQAPLALDSAALAFEIASVRRDTRKMLPVTRVRMMPGGRFEAESSLQSLIAYAYDLKTHERLQGKQEILRDRFVIMAKAPSDMVVTAAIQRHLVQRLLAERFRLRIRVESELRSVSVLRRVRADRIGPGLLRMSEECVGGFAVGRVIEADSSQERCNITLLNGRLSGLVKSLPDLATMLSANAQHPIVDETGLTGSFLVNMSFNPETLGPVRLASGSPLSSLPAFADALRDDLGLKLETETRSVRTVIVENVEELFEN